MKARTGILFLAVVACGCARPMGRGIADDDASFKIPAIKEAVEEKDRDAIPQLIDDLDSDDPAVRFYSIEALRRLTGETFGYRYYQSETERQPAIERWKAWSAKQ